MMMFMNDYRIYHITVGCDKSSFERTYKVLALEPVAATTIALNLANKDKWPMGSNLAAVNLVLADNRVKN